MHVLVLGAGISGLSSAVRLFEAGHTVEIWARDRPRETTSAVAAAIWYPYRAAPADKVSRWGAVTFHELVRLAANPETGVTLREGFELFREPAGDPFWASAVPGFRRATAAELPAGYVDGYAMRLPVADMSIYLGWLEQRVTAGGANFIQRSIGHLGEARGAADVVVNCTGLGAREVAKDAEVFGVRGQVQVVNAPQVSSFFIDDLTTTYIIPRVCDVVLGGTADEYVEENVVDPAAAASIRERCAQIVSGLEGAPVIANRVGIRPCRPAIRLEREVVDGIRVVHNYGHGGAGVTLSWGCADDVAALVG
jgi:D-amino-acid oxidase